MFLSKGGLGAPSSKQHSSAIALAILIAVTLYSCYVQAGDSNSDNFFLFMRKRLGHFANYGPSSPYGSIYQEYFKSVIQKNDIAMESIDVNDWRHVRPSGDTCIEFLIGFQVKEYILSKPFDIIPLDSCLDWIFDESEEKKLDMGRLRASQKKEVRELKADTKLKELFESTKFKDNKLPKTLTDNIYEYLVKLLKINSDNPKNGCHSLWLQAYIDFIEEIYLGDCEDEENCNFYNNPESTKDSYLNLIAESSKWASRTCYRVMQTQMRGLIEQEYDSSKSVPTSLAMKFRTNSLRVKKQSEKEKWSREMIGILQLAAGSDQDKPINLASVVHALDRIKNGDSATTERFTGALSQYALDNVDLKDSANDPTGRNRYGKAMSKLCRPYIDQTTFLPQAGGTPLDDEEDNRKPFEFYNLIYSLVRITNHEPTFKIPKEKLENDVLANKWEALYLATFACQIISTTWGSLDYETNTGSFSVKLRPNSRVLIEDWPIEVLNEKLPVIYGETQSQSSKLSFGMTESSLGSSSVPKLGRKFKGIFSKKYKQEKKSSPLMNIFHHNSKSDTTHPTSEPKPTPAPAPAPKTPKAEAPQVKEQPAFIERPVITGPMKPPVGTKMSPETMRMFKEIKGYYPTPNKPTPTTPRPFVPETTKSPEDRWAAISV